MPSLNKYFLLDGCGFSKSSSGVASPSDPRGVPSSATSKRGVESEVGKLGSSPSSVESAVSADGDMGQNTAMNERYSRAAKKVPEICCVFWARTAE